MGAVRAPVSISFYSPVVSLRKSKRRDRCLRASLASVVARFINLGGCDKDEVKFCRKILYQPSSGESFISRYSHGRHRGMWWGLRWKR